MKRKKTIRRSNSKTQAKRPSKKRRLNYGEGNLFNFHGAFIEKADALKKEKATPDAFIRTMWFKGGPRYAVLTRKNPVRKIKLKKTARRETTRKKRRAKRKNTIAWGTGDQKFVHQALQQLFPGKRTDQLTPAQLSRVLQLAQVLKVGKKNPVRKVPGGWRAIGPRGRMGPVLPTQRDAEIYAESLKMANPRRRNYADATELYKKFHGRGPGRVTDTGLPAADYGSHHELGQLGRLVSLTIGDEEAEKPWKKKIEWGSREAPDLAAEPGGRQLYIIGGSQNLDSQLEALPIDADKDMLDLGFAYQIEYFSQKRFDGFQPVTYWHDLGEETGDHPRVVYDQVKKRIHIVGGAYEVKPEGIVN